MSSVTSFGARAGVFTPAAATADVVAVSREAEAVGPEELVGNELLRLRRELRQIVRPPRPGGTEAVDALRGGGADACNGEARRRRNSRRGRRRHGLLRRRTGGYRSDDEQQCEGTTHAGDRRPWRSVLAPLLRPSAPRVPPRTASPRPCCPPGFLGVGDALLTNAFGRGRLRPRASLARRPFARPRRSHARPRPARCCLRQVAALASAWVAVFVAASALSLASIAAAAAFLRRISARALAWRAFVASVRAAAIAFWASSSFDFWLASSTLTFCSSRCARVELALRLHMDLCLGLPPRFVRFVD